jgi:uncharacterized protein (TIGR03382 family)
MKAKSKWMSSAAMASAPVCAAALLCGFSGKANAGTFPGFGADTLGPALIITIAANGTASLGPGPGSAQGPYDSSDDSYIGVVNLSASVISSIGLTGTPGGTGSGTFGFDGDGIDTFGATSNSSDTTGYGGPHGFFSSVNTAAGTAVVNFLGGIAATTGTDYFSLEGPPSSLGGLGIVVNPVPGPIAGAGGPGIVAAFAGVFAWLRRRRRQSA